MALARSGVLQWWPGIVLLGLLLLLDTGFDVIRGTQGNPIFKPIEQAYGIGVFPLLALPALIGFALLAKALGWLVERTDRVPRGPELILAALVLIFAVHDLWVFSVDFLGFRLIQNYLYMIPIYIAIGLGYALWAERRLRRAA